MLLLGDIESGEACLRCGFRLGGRCGWRIATRHYNHGTGHSYCTSTHQCRHVVSHWLLGAWVHLCLGLLGGAGEPFAILETQGVSIVLALFDPLHHCLMRGYHH